MGSDFLTGINKTIGDNMRFVRDYQANPQNYTSSGSTTSSSSSSSSSSSTDPMQLLNPMIMLMMLQVMAKMTGTDLSQMDYSPYLSNVNNTSQTSSGTSSSSISQNPAVSYFDSTFEDLAAQSTDDTGISWSDDQTAALKDQVTQGKLTMTQVGQALMYELDKTDAANLPAVGGAIASLMESGDLNITPFLQNDYLSSLQPQSQETLFQAVETSGLRLANGQPNSRFVSFLLENLSQQNPNRASQPETQAFIQQFMQDFYGAYGQDATTPVGSTLSQILNLTNITADDQGNLVFS